MSLHRNTPAPAPGSVVHAWRHPKSIGAEGRCIGARTDLPVDQRKAKRLAHRIRQQVRREGLACEVATSPLRRCRDVARWLRCFGFRCVVDARLAEVDFGAWDGRHWDDIAREEIDAWAADLDGYRPGGGECVRELRARVGEVLRAPPSAVLITHGGWVSAAVWRERVSDAVAARSDGWPRAPALGQCRSFHERVFDAGRPIALMCATDRQQPGPRVSARIPSR